MAVDSKFDAYLAKSAPFARPILDEIRRRVHAALPDVEETVKWGMPHFMLQGRNMLGMGAFKKHVRIFFHQDGTVDPLAAKLTCLADLPDEAAFAERLLERRNDLANPVPKAHRADRADKPEIAVPDDLSAALSAEARLHFQHFTPAQRREYLVWITEAKRPETRACRIAEAAGWIAQGKKRNWKYEQR